MEGEANMGEGGNHTLSNLSQVTSSQVQPFSL